MGFEFANRYSNFKFPMPIKYRLNIFKIYINYYYFIMKVRPTALSIIV